MLQLQECSTWVEPIYIYIYIYILSSSRHIFYDIGSVVQWCLEKSVMQADDSNGIVHCSSCCF